MSFDWCVLCSLYKKILYLLCSCVFVFSCKNRRLCQSAVCVLCFSTKNILSMLSPCVFVFSYKMSDYVCMPCMFCVFCQHVCLPFVCVTLSVRRKVVCVLCSCVFVSLIKMLCISFALCFCALCHAMK